MRRATLNRDEWIAEFAKKIDAEPPTPQEVRALLKLAAVAAHSSERTAAPVACWIGGRSGLSLEELQDAADSVGDGGAGETGT